MADSLKEVLLENANKKPQRLGEQFLGFIVFIFLIIGITQGHPIAGASAGAFIASVLSAIGAVNIFGIAIGLGSLGLLLLLLLGELLFWLYRKISSMR
jgi:hypothetical protein